MITAQPKPSYARVTSAALFILLATTFSLRSNASNPGTGLASIASSSDNITSFDFDNQGRLTARTEPSGAVLRYEYDANDLPSKIATPDGVVQYQRDAVGRPVFMQDASGTTRYEYDAFDQLTRIAFDRPAAKHTAVYTHDPWGRIHTVAIQDGNGKSLYSVRFDYDVLGRVRSVDDGRGAVTYQYRSEKAEATRKLPNGVQSTLSFSTLGPWSSIRHVSSSGDLIAGYDYAYRPMQRRIEVSETLPGARTTRIFEFAREGVFRGILGPRPTGAAPPLPSGLGPKLAPEPRIIRDGNGACAARDAGRDSWQYLTAPLGEGQILVAEIGKDHQFSRAFLSTPYLSMEHRPNAGNTYYLERDLPCPDAPLRSRIAETTIAAALPTAVVSPVHNAVLRPEPPPVIFVAGVNSYGEALRREVDRQVAPAAVLVTTSIGGIHGGQWGIRLEGVHLGWLTMGVDSLRAAANYLGAGPFSLWPWPEHASGFAGQDLRRAIINNPSCETLYAHSNGAITVYNGRKMIADLKAAGNTDISRVVIGGCGLAARLQDYFDRRGANIQVLDASGGEGFADIVRAVFTTPNVQLSREVFSPVPASAWLHWLSGAGLKIGGLAGGAFDALRGKESIGLAAHRIDHIAWNSPCPVDFAQAEKQLGGIALSATAALPSNLGRIVAVVYDPASQRLVLVGDGSTELPPIKLEHLAVALRCVFDQPPCNPQFSLDPAVPTQPDGPWQKAVYLPPEVLADSDFGQLMYEADWLLKQYCFGTVLKPKDWLTPGWKQASGCDGVEEFSSGRARSFVQNKRTVDVPGFQSLMDLSLAEPNRSNKPIRARAWIVADKVILKTADQGLVFTSVKMRVEARQQEIGPDGRLRDTKSDDPLTKRFADIMTRSYDEIAQVEPVFAELKELAKAIAIAKWLKQEGVPVDLAWISEVSTQKKDTIRQVSRLTTTREERTEKPYRRGNKIGTVTETRQISLSGGIDLTVRPQNIPDDGTASREANVIREELSRSTEPVFLVKQGARTQTAVVLPITKAGQGSGLDHAIQHAGMTCQLDPLHRVKAATDNAGNHFDFDWDKDGHLAAVRWETPAGWHAQATPADSGTSISISTPSGHQAALVYGPNRLLTRLSVDGKPYATCRYDSASREVTVDYAGGTYSEGEACDQRGRLVTYSRTVHDESKPVRTETVQAGWNEKNLLARLEIRDIGETIFQYDAAGTLTAVETPAARWQYQRDGQGQILGMDGPAESRLRAEYAGEVLKKLSLDIEGGQVQVAFDGGHISEVIGNDGLAAKCLYNDTGSPTEMRLASGQTIRWEYDSFGRLSRLSVPALGDVICEYDTAARGAIAWPRRIRVMEKAARPVAPSEESRSPDALLVEKTPKSPSPLAKPPSPVKPVERPAAPATPPQKAADLVTTVDRPAHPLTTPKNTPRSAALPAPVLKNVRIQGGDLEIHSERGPVAWEGLAGLHRKPLGTPEGQTALIRIREHWVKDFGQPQPGQVHVLTYDVRYAEIAEQLRRALSHSFPGSLFVTTTDSARAIENIQRWQPVRQGEKSNLAAWVVKDTFLPGQYEAITKGTQGRPWINIAEAARGLTEDPPAENIVVITGEMDQPLRDRIMTAAQAGHLKGKFVISWSCGSPMAQDLSHELLDAGVAGVWLSPMPVDARVIPELESSLDAIMDQKPFTLGAALMNEVLDHALRRLQGREQREQNQKNLDEIRMLIKQLEHLLEYNLRTRRDDRGDAQDATV